MQVLTHKKWVVTNLILAILLVGFVVLFSFLGNPVISPRDLWGRDKDEVLSNIFFYARLPRILLAVLVGAGLSTSGVAFQSLLRNSLADPYILGVAGGAALGGILTLVLGFPFQVVTIMAFLSAIASLFMIYSIAQVKGHLPAHTLLLTGVIFNAFSFALILLINSVVQMGQMHQILYILMGSLEAQTYEALVWVGSLTLAGFLLVFFNAAKMNLVALGEESATQLGLNVERYRKVIFFGASLMVGACVSVAGLIGFVGLFVPHIMRLLLGTDHRLLVPASALGGALFLIFCDFVARTLFSAGGLQTQLPVGVITALIGGPFFVYLLRRGRGGSPSC